MNEICQIGNFQITKINSLFCSLCYNIISTNSKKCQNVHCNSFFCEECINKYKKLECPLCKKGKLINNSTNSFQYINELLFFCSKSFKCKGKYTYEEIKNNHNHKNSQIIKCNGCNINLKNTPNNLKCIKCKNYFYYNNIKYNPFLCKEIKHSEKNCGTRCFKCFNPICNKCNKYKSKYTICPECNFLCQICLKNKSNCLCEFCDKMICESCIKICKKCSSILCKNDYKNIKECSKHKIKINKDKCSICNKNKSIKICSICYSKICISSCLTICSSCNNIICLNCSLFCNICKNIICKKCSIKCTNCPNNKTLVVCVNCNSDTIKNCSVKGCSTKLCLKCLKICNFCEEINCDAHSLSCANCSETICRFHWHICKKCSDDNNEYNYVRKKLCLKNCTYSCHFCQNEINALCKEENHIDNFCRQYPCGHFVCNSCTKKCDDCQKVILGCSECELDSNYIHCRICGKSTCFDCGKKCLNCDEYYCNEIHNCFICAKEITNNICPNCDFSARSKCLVCSKGLNQCETCFRKIICSSQCFLNYYMNNNIKKNKNASFSRSHTIQSNKSTSYKTNVTNNMINSVINLFQNNNYKDKEKNSTHYNNNFRNKSELETDREKHICLMYWCEDHMGINSKDGIMMKSNTLKDLMTRDSSNNINIYKKQNNQTNIKCSSCSII